jgi:DNA repair exonuclease SbcCD ATPase subunit
MSALVPPFDIVPKLPGKGVNLVVKQIDQQIDRLIDTVNKTLQESIKLPLTATCDDPLVKKIKDDLAKIQELIAKIQENIPKVQSAVNTIRTLIDAANTVKAAITAAQLANPVTAPLFIAQQLQAIQDATIANAIASLDQFKSIPDSLASKLAVIVPPLLGALQRISTTCNGDLDGLENIELPESVVNEVSGLTEDYNDLLPSEFYNELNVSDEDLQQRSDNIETLVQQQRDLLTSLLEAPSKVYQQPGIPAAELGKLGDYYIDTLNNTIYGPKFNSTSWGPGINY